MNPTSFQYAAQVFSGSVSAAIITASVTGQLKSKTTVDIGIFFKKINDIFDCLNSRVVNNSNPFSSGLSVYNTLPSTTLNDAISLFQNIRSHENERKNIYCTDGFEWTIRGTLMLWDDLRQNGVKYLLTSQLNQDPLENAFSVIRHCRGYKPQPTVK